MAAHIDELRQRAGNRPIPPDSADREQRSCPDHGAYSAAVWSRQAGRVLRRFESPCPACLAELQALEAAESAERARAEAERLRGRLIASSGLGELYAGASLAGYLPATQMQKEALRACRQWQDAMPANRGEGLILSGPCGVGKTHLMAALLLEGVALGWSVRYVTVAEMIRSIRATWTDRARSEDELIRELVGVKLLAIDELGVQAGSESEHGLLHAVIDARLRARRPTLCGTNLSAQELPGAIGERALDRLRQMCRMVVIDGESFRRNRRVCIELG